MSRKIGVYRSLQFFEQQQQQQQQQQLFSAASVNYCKTRNVFMTTEIPSQESKSVRKRLDFTRFVRFLSKQIPV